MAEAAKNVCDETCEGCMYYAQVNRLDWFCNYYFKTDKRRPCPAGKGCTVRREKRRKRSK